IRSEEQDGAPNGTLAIQELMAATDEAYAGLWSYLFGVDLVELDLPAAGPLAYAVGERAELPRHGASDVPHVRCLRCGTSGEDEREREVSQGHHWSSSGRLQGSGARSQYSPHP
ncbi:MAG: hypothetical protein IIA54_00450, partial [Chloroflexi bacterium]|nr:hypothetical protein [Chloroflexota bacterium]